MDITTPAPSGQQWIKQHMWDFPPQGHRQRTPVWSTTRTKPHSGFSYFNQPAQPPDQNTNDNHPWNLTHPPVGILTLMQPHTVDLHQLDSNQVIPRTTSGSRPQTRTNSRGTPTTQTKTHQPAKPTKAHPSPTRTASPQHPKNSPDPEPARGC